MQIRDRTYVELALCMFAFFSFYMAMMTNGLAVVSFAALTVFLVLWVPFWRAKENRLTRALSVGLIVAAIIRVIFRIMPRATL